MNKLTIIFLLLINLFSVTALRADVLSSAEVEYESKNFSKAYEVWSRQALLDNPIAVSGLGMLYLFGQGVAQDQKKGFQLLKKAAELGDARGQSGLGLVFYQGYGVSKDFKQAAYWFQKAAHQDRHQAQFNLAWMYQYGQGIKQDLEIAAYWHQRASDLGNVKSKTQLAILYAAGMGVKQDYKKSFSLARQAAEYGEVLAQNHLGDLYAHGDGVNQDYVQASYWYRKALEKGDAYAQHALGQLYWNGLGVEKDLKFAFDLYKKAGEQGNIYAISHLGLLLLEGKEVARDLSSAAHWFSKGAAKGDDFSKAMLAYMYEFGVGLSRDMIASAEWYSKISTPSNRRLSQNKPTSRSISYDDLSGIGVFNGIPRLPISYNIDRNLEFISPVAMERLSVWSELTVLLRSTVNLSFILSVYDGSDFNSTEDYFDASAIERRRHEIKKAIAVLDELYSTPDATSHLSSVALDWLSIINARLRSMDDIERSQHLLLETGSKLVSLYKSPDILYIEGIRLLWEYHVNVYYRSRSVDYKKEVADTLKKLGADLVRPDVLIAQAYFHDRGEYLNSYCQVLASSLIISSATPPIAEIDRARSSLRLYRTILEDANYCAKLSQETYVSIVKGFATELNYAGKSKEMVAIMALIEPNEPRSPGVGGVIDSIINRGHLFAKIGKYQSAFIEFIQARQLILENQDFDRLAHANRALSGALVGLGNTVGAISLLMPQLHIDYMSFDVFSYCSSASAMNRATSSSSYASIGISALKTCIELFFDESRWAGRNKSFVDWFIFEQFFKQLEETLIGAGRLAEAQIVIDMLREQEYLEFTRGNDGANRRHTRIGYTPAEKRWMSRYREIADRLATLGKEEQGLQKQAKGGLTDEQSRRLTGAGCGSKGGSGRLSSPSWIRCVKSSLPRVSDKQIEVTESSVQGSYGVTITCLKV